MKLNEDDIIKFYELQGRYDPISRNVGIVGTKERYKKFIKRYIEEFKGARVILNEDITICKIIVKDDIEYSFIYIKTLQDLRGYKFRKFI